MRMHIVPDGAPVYTCATARLSLRYVAAVEVLATVTSAEQNKRIYSHMPLRVCSDA